jgi:hypothetical protein
MNRTVALVLTTVLVFSGTVSLLLYILPGPHQPTDYLVSGAVATLLCLLLLFVLLIKRKPKT